MSKLPVGDERPRLPPNVQLPPGVIAASADMIAETLGEVLELMKEAKPNDRSEVDRYWAICVTDMEKLVAVFERYVARK